MKYTIQEIDSLRYILTNEFLYGSYFPEFDEAMCSRSYRQEELTNYVEQRVRTLMEAGIKASDIKENNK